jgi:hypothetical protein
MSKTSKTRKGAKEELPRRLDQKIIDSLESSHRITGPLQSIVRCMQHPDKTLIGSHRERTGAKDFKIDYYDVDALARKQGLSHSAAEEVVTINGNQQRRVKKSETRVRVERLAAELKMSGVPVEEVATRLAAILPHSHAYIDTLLPDEYKRRDHAHSSGRPRKESVFSEKRNACESCGKQSEATKDICPDCFVPILLLRSAQSSKMPLRLDVSASSARYDERARSIELSKKRSSASSIRLQRFENVPERLQRFRTFPRATALDR